MASTQEFDYQLIVVGGGSGGMACVRKAADLGIKCAVLDFVKPSTYGKTSWGLGGTCVNVGCIPKKMMHTASIHGEARKDQKAFGWPELKGEHSWEGMVEGIHAKIQSMNRGYETQLEYKGVDYYNALGKFVDQNTIELTDKDGGTVTKTASYFVIAVGGRPRELGCPGEEHAITSDDIFWRKKSPGKCLVVGASYVALECAGFMTGLGQDVTVMVRSIPLRGYDLEVSNRIVDYMGKTHTKFIRSAVVEKIEKIESSDGKSKLRVTYKPHAIKTKPGQEDGHMRPAGTGGVIEVDTILAAVGRIPDTKGLGLENAGIKVTRKGEIPTNAADQTSTANIFCIGDVAVGRPELTPVAIQAGKMVAKRLAGKSKQLMDYDRIATTVFTPIEYGAVGLPEDHFRTKTSNDTKFDGNPDNTYAAYTLQKGISVHKTEFTPLEWYLTKERKDQPKCFMKVIVDDSDGRMLGIHYLGPNAGEIMQFASLAVRCGATFDELSDTVGIHPTCAEVFTILQEKSEHKVAAATDKAQPPVDEACST